jgi:cysteine desulfurase/selenocysteine lyase
LTNWDEVRKKFPVTEKSIYLNSAGFSVTCLPAMEAISEFAQKMLYFQEHIWADGKRNDARAQAAQLIHATPAEVGLGEGATYGLSVFARTLSNGLQPGDNIITTDMEFLQSTLPWQIISKRKRVEIKGVKNRNGTYDVSDFEKMIDARTKVITVSSVQWNNGFKMDIAHLGEIVRKKNIFLIVDAAQHLGAVEFDCNKMNVDFLSASGHKWLVSPFGIGIFFVSKRVLESIEPDIVGYINVKPPRDFTRMMQFFENPDSSPLEEFRPIRDEARKFEVGGTANYPGAIGLNASLQMFNNIGMSNIASRVLDLGDYLIQQLEKINVTIVSPKDRERRAGITTIRVSKTPDEEKKLLAWLKEREFYVSLRFASNIGGIRVSTHLYNNEADIDKFAAAIKEYRQKQV